MARKKKFAPNDNNLAIAYYRFSSHSQNDASIDQQRELAHDWADAHGFKIVQEYEDAAISGTTDARPGFQQMLSEVAKIRPHTLIMWKTDRLGRDKYVLAMAKKKIRDAGCEIHLLAEHIPTEGPEGVLIEGLMEAMAEYYSRQLSQNIQRGMDYNAQHALYNGHKLFGYDVDRSTKKYIPDPSTVPFVQWAFKEYASGRPLKAIAEEMNAQGLRTPRNAKFSVNMLNKMLKNRAYIGEYHHGDITVAGGMPVLVDEATFDRAQRRFAENKRKGSQRAHGMDDADAPRYWLTGKLYCGECGSTMQGVSGTSKTGRTYYYYYCSAQRRKECHLHKARKRDLEDMVLFALHNIVDDEENVTALALDAAEYYERNHNDAAYLEALEAKRREVEKSLANLVKVIERGVVSDTVTQRLAQLEEQKSALNDAIGTENVRVSLCEDRHSIQAYFDKFLHADVNDPEIRDQVFEYFVDKVYLYDDKLVVSMWFSEDDKQEITWRDWFSLDEYWTDESPFVKGGGVEFDCFPLGSTISLAVILVKLRRAFCVDTLMFELDREVYCMKKVLSVSIKTIIFFVGWAICVSVIPIPDTASAVIWRFWAELIPLLSVIAITLIFWLADQKKIRLHLTGKPVYNIILGGVTGTIWLGASVGILSILGVVQIEGKNQIAMLWLWLFAAFLNTVMQEMLVRGYLYQMIKSNSNIAAAIIVSTGLFTFAHGGAFEAGILPVLNVITMSLFMTAVLEYTGSLIAPIVIHFLWNGVGAIILGGVSLAEDYPHLFDMTIHGNPILSGGSCKIEGSIIVLFMNLAFLIGFVAAKKRKDRNR